MGEMKFFKQEINRIVKTAEARNTINELKALRRSGVTSEELDIGLYDQIHMMLRDAQKQAEELAFNNLKPGIRDAIEQRILLKQMNDSRAMAGKAPIPTPRPTHRY